MTIESKEEVFSWFTNLSGAKRIEVLSGLVHSCIPLEWRFLATLVESLARRDYLSLIDDELKANSTQELSTLCSSDLLSDTSPLMRFGMVANSRPGSASSPNKIVFGHNVHESDAATDELIVHNQNEPTSPVPTMITSIPDVVNNAYVVKGGSQNQSNVPHQPVQSISFINPTVVAPPVELLSNGRKRMVVYLCLLSSSNRVAATIIFDGFRKSLTADNLKRHLDISTINLANLSIRDRSDGDDRNEGSSNTIRMQGPSSNSQIIPNTPILDPQLVAEINLIHTLAIYHPAFTYEQQSILSHELKKFNDLFNFLMNYSTRYNVSYTYNTLHPSHPAPIVDFMDVESNRSPPLSCYNCGASGHLGKECTEETLDDATRDTNFQINLNPPIQTIVLPSVVSLPHPSTLTQPSLTPPNPRVEVNGPPTTSNSRIPNNIQQSQIANKPANSAANNNRSSKQQPLYQPPAFRRGGDSDPRHQQELSRTSSNNRFSNSNNHHGQHQ